MTTHTERDANAQIERAIAALNSAISASTLANYGPQVLDCLDEAAKQASYALRVAQGKV